MILKEALLLFVFAVVSCGDTSPQTVAVKRLSVAACGDVLYYDGNYRHFAENGSVDDFYAVTESVAESIRRADVAIVNQEAMSAGRSFGLSGYPLFNTPFESVEALRKTGFDIFATANNHSFDRGRAGIEASVDYLTRTGALFVGTATAGSDPLRPLLLLINDISLAVFSFTDVTNIAYPSPSPVAHTFNRPLLRERLQEAAQTTDFVLIMLHYGEEYTVEPTSANRDLVQFLVDNGADVVFGNHAHVLRPFETFPSPKGGQAFVFWGLGNFVGWMSRKPLCSVGGIFCVELTVSQQEEGNCVRTVTEPSVELTYSVNSGKIHRTVFLREAAEFGADVSKLTEEATAVLKSHDPSLVVF